MCKRLGVVAGAKAHGADCADAHHFIQAGHKQEEAAERVVPMPVVSLPDSNGDSREAQLHAHGALEGRSPRLGLLGKAWHRPPPCIGYLVSVWDEEVATARTNWLL